MRCGATGESDDGRLRLERCRHPSFRHSRSLPPCRDRVLEGAGSADGFPGSGSWGPGVDRTVEKQAGLTHFQKVPADGTHGRELQLWIVGDGNGFQVLRFTNAFIETE